VGLWSLWFRKTRKPRSELLDLSVDLPRSKERESGKHFRALRVDNKDRRVVYHGVRLMRSERWSADAGGSRITPRGIPFIMKSGHIAGSCCMTWRCSSYQWIATVTRMVLNRIKHRTVVSRRSRYKTWNQLAQVAAFYVITNNERAFERLLQCKKEGFVGLLNYYIHRVDEQKRFLLDQTLKGVLWFQLRGNPRVKSTKKTIIEKYRNFSVKNFDTTHERRSAANVLCDPWIVRNDCHTKGLNLLAPGS